MKNKNTPDITVIIAAAGSGTRLGGVSKPLMKLCGRQVLLYSIDTFMKNPRVERIVISAKKEEVGIIKDIIARENYIKETIVVEGGSTRQESVKLAFSAAFKRRRKTKFVAIHDAARPLISDEEFEHACATAEKFGNAVCAAKAKDTFKIGDKNRIITGHVERENLWHIQTPQIFDTDMFHTSLALAEKNLLEATDESGLVTEAGFVVKLSECGHDNIKITYPEDIFIAEAILAKRKYMKELEKKHRPEEKI